MSEACYFFFLSKLKAFASNEYSIHLEVSIFIVELIIRRLQSQAIKKFALHFRRCCNERGTK